jgi:hypothetical protein
MSDFLGRLAGRSMGVEPVVQPVIPAMTAPVSRGAFGESESFRDAAEEPAARDRVSSPEIVAARDRWNRPHSLTVQSGSDAHREVIVRPPIGSPDVRAAAFPPLEGPLHPTLSAAALDGADSAAAGTAGWDRTLPGPAGVDASTASVGTAMDRRETAPAAAPIVRVTIGRIEVRAELSSPKPRTASATRTKSAATSLDDYLKQRSEGRR